MNNYQAKQTLNLSVHLLVSRSTYHINKQLEVK